MLITVVIIYISIIVADPFFSGLIKVDDDDGVFLCLILVTFAFHVLLPLLALSLADNYHYSFLLYCCYHYYNFFFFFFSHKA